MPRPFKSGQGASSAIPHKNFLLRLSARDIVDKEEAESEKDIDYEIIQFLRDGHIINNRIHYADPNKKSEIINSERYKRAIAERLMHKIIRRANNILTKKGFPQFINQI